MSNLTNTIVIIPCYEPSAKKFLPYLEELTKTDVKNVLIVDDGSGEKYQGVFDRAKQISPKILCTGYQENKGKGYALRFAFNFAKEHYDQDTVFVTADCDGQHLVKDVLKIAGASMQNPNALILGSRDFSLSQVPKRSRSGNTKTSAILKFLYGVKINDTQTGLRGFSYCLLDKLLKISGDRFEYETNQLIKLYQQEVPIREVSIETVYEEMTDDVEKKSHFKTFSDSVKVIGVLLKNLGWYFFSSVISAVLDVAVFALLFSVILTTPDLTVKTLIATVTARVASSIVNFTCNYKLVFHGTSKSSIVRYYILWLVQLGASFGLARLWASITQIELLVSALKAVSDILLAVLSYQIQCNWVFKKKSLK